VVKQANPELQAGFSVLQRLWVRDYEGVWPQLRFGWTAQLQPLAEALAGRVRQRTMRLVSAAYSTLSPEKLAALLGTSQQEAIAG
jgi:hypothetical protein